MDQLASFFWKNLEAVMLFITAISSLFAASVGPPRLPSTKGIAGHSRRIRDMGDLSSP